MGLKLQALLSPTSTRRRVNVALDLALTSEPVRGPRSDTWGRAADQTREHVLISNNSCDIRALKLLKGSGLITRMAVQLFRCILLSKVNGFLDMEHDMLCLEPPNEIAGLTIPFCYHTLRHKTLRAPQTFASLGVL